MAWKYNPFTNNLDDTGGATGPPFAATTNNVYVDSASGSNVTGTGTAINPYQTITFALTSITTNTVSNVFCIKAQGIFSENAIVLKPWVSLEGNGQGATRISVTGPGNNVTLSSAFGSVTGGTVRMDVTNIQFGPTCNLSWIVPASGGSNVNIFLRDCLVSGSTAFGGRTGSDFFQCWNCELAGQVTATDCLFQTYQNIYDTGLLYRNVAAPGSSFMVSSGDLLGTLAVTAGTAQSISAFVSGSVSAGGVTITGGTATLDYDALLFPQGALTLLTGGTATPQIVPSATFQIPGTFTPVLAFGGASVGITYGTQYGRYVRTGNSVEIMIQITLTSKGSSSGTATISALPFTAGAATPGKWLSAFTSNLTYSGVAYTTLAAQITPSSTVVGNIWQLPDNNSVALNMTDSNFTNTSTVIITGTYWTDS